MTDLTTRPSSTADAVTPIAPKTRPTLLARLGQVSPTVTVGVLLLVVIAIFSLTTPGFFGYSNATTIVSSASVIMVASLGQLLVLISGGFDLSIGGVIPLTAVLFAVTTTAGLPTPVVMLVCFGAAAVVGLVNMLAVVVVKINALIATLGTLSVTGGVAYTIAKGQTLSVPSPAGILGEFVLPSIPLYVVLIVVLLVVMHLVLQHTIFGRRIYMVGGNPEAARLAGVRSTAVGGSVYVLSSLFAAFAGIILASQLLAATGGVGADNTLQTMAAVVLGGAALTGGRGSVVGALIGVLFLGIINNGLSLLHVPSFYQQIVTGVVLLLAVALSRFQESSRRRS